MKTTLGQIGPSKTPGIIRQLIIYTCIATLLTAFIDPLILGKVRFGLQYFLSLSAATFNSFYFWQPISYLFVLQPYGGIDFGLIISLFFQMFILWMMGSGIAERYGSLSFAKLYFGSGILAGLLALPYYQAFPYSLPLAGPTASLYATFVVWTILHQNTQILLFFVIPVKAKWLLAGGLGASLLVFVSQGSVLSLILLIVGSFSGYLYATVFKEISLPFAVFEPIDRFFIKLGQWLRKPKVKKSKKKGSKIVNFPNGKPIEQDNEFVDRMLDKISKHGRNSLSKEEKERLDKISKRK